MKKFFLVLVLTIVILIVIGISGFAQIPKSFKYQAIARGSDGTSIVNQDIGIRLSILSGSTEGDVVYSETHTPTSNNFGLITLEIGNGTSESGNISAIDWKTETFFLQIEIDVNGGNDYMLMGTSQMLSVPYALQAEQAEEADYAATALVAAEALTALNATGVTLTSPNGTKYQLTVDDDGSISAVEGENAITEDQAVQIISQALSGETGGMEQQIAALLEAMQTTPDLSRKRDGSNACDFEKDTTIALEADDENLSVEYKYKFTYGINCNQLSIPTDLFFNFTGNVLVEGTNTDFENAVEGEWIVTEILPASDNYVINGFSGRMGSFSFNLLNCTVSYSLDQIFTEVNVEKETGNIVSGTGTVTIEGTTDKGKTFSFTACITFNSDQTATISIGDQEFTVELNTSEIYNAITGTEAAEVIASYLATDQGGTSSQLTAFNNLMQSAPSFSKRTSVCDFQKDTTVESSYSGALIEYDYSYNYVYGFNCNYYGIPENLSFDFSGALQYSGTKITFTDELTGQWIITGIYPTSENYIVNGTIERSGSNTIKILTTSVTTITSSEQVYKNININKETGEIVSGSGAITLSGQTNSGDSFSFSASVTFPGDGTAIISLQDNSFEVDLENGDVNQL